MTIAKDFAGKAVVAFVAAAMIFSMFAPLAQAQSSADLQKMIDDLMKQVAALQGQGGTSSGVASGVCPFTWTRDLKTGVTGADVMKLQQFLNSNADTRVSASGAGSVGMETEYFGPATAAAVSKFQVMHRADILTPSGLVNPTGFFGPSTRAKANSLCTTAPTPTPGEDDEDEGDTDNGDLQGEGTLDTFEIDEADDTDIQESAEDEVIAELTMEAADGDIEVDRMTLTLAGVSTPTEADPWDVFDTITLWVDGDEVASFDASDEDNYLDEDTGEFRFTGLNLVLREDEEVEVQVAASVAGNVDDAGTDASWEISVDEIRYFDADGVAEDDDTTGDLTDAVGFDIVEVGDGEELNFSLGSGNPDATDIVVDTDAKTTGVTVMEYTIEAKEGDIELNELSVLLTTSDSMQNVVDDVTLDIDGDTFDAEQNATNSSSTLFTFDIDGDVTIDDGDEVTVKVMVDFRAQEVSNNVPRYANGTTIKAEVTSTERDQTDAEGADDVNDFSGSAIGKTHTLVAEGIVLPVDGVETSTDVSGDNSQTGEFTIEFEVTAVEADFYVREFATLGATTTGVTFSVEGPTGYVATSSGTISSTADEDTAGVFTVREGETETFTLVVTVDTNITGQHRVSLTGVYYTDNANGVTGSEIYTPTPAQDFRTAFRNINAN
jgi:peptidoglycan hydrolase-like protein with peptidoglycan-binding domain